MNLEEPKDANERAAEDRWLDEALAQYSAAEPRMGLENRILANLEAHSAGRRRKWFYVFAATAAVMLFAVLVTTLRTGNQVTPDNTARNKPSDGQNIHPDNANSQSRNTMVQVTRKHHVPAPNKLTNRAAVLPADVKQEHFPADRPPSEQDRLLLAYLNRTPPQEMEHVVAVQQEVAAARQRWEDETNSEQRP